jgi:hypothetical protein
MHSDESKDTAPAGPPVRHCARRYSAEECFANMGRLWRHYGRPPYADEADRPPSTVGRSAYMRRAGSWRRAVEAYARFCGVALERVAPEPANGEAGAGTPDGPARAAEAPLRHATRKIPLSLRFRVLQRDRFACTACGNSPASDPTCRLHADHVVPWSQGGRTELGNLRTLCAACNLGRGAGKQPSATSLQPSAES